MQKLLLIFIITTTSAWSASSYQSDYRRELFLMAKQNHHNVGPYSKAREIVIQKLHLKQDNRGYYVQDVYCQLVFRNNIGPRQMPSHQVLNIEHTWPQNRFTREFRKSLQKNDLHHLYPTEARSNSTRNNLYFHQFEYEARPVHESCDASQRGRIDGENRRGFEPPLEHKGNVARAMFYFAVRYKVRIPEYEEFFLRQWHFIDPVDSEEIERNDLIEDYQGNRNPFIDDPDLVNLISDF